MVDHMIFSKGVLILSGYILASDADVFGLVNINSLNAILGCYLLVNDQ